MAEAEWKGCAESNCCACWSKGYDKGRASRVRMQKEDLSPDYRLHVYTVDQLVHRYYAGDQDPGSLLLELLGRIESGDLVPLALENEDD